MLIYPLYYHLSVLFAVHHNYLKFFTCLIKLYDFTLSLIYQKQTNMNKLKTPQQKANERYQAESIKPIYAFLIVCVAFIITAILQNI
jgi:hypothetical protein